MTSKPRIFKYDGTIHAGHLLTILTIIVCTIGAWMQIKSDVAVLDHRSNEQESRLRDERTDREDADKDMELKIAAVIGAQRQEINKLRDDMNAWFMRLNDKVDIKEDKRR